MDKEILPVQKEQLITWADKRDSILLEISNLQIEKEKLEKTNKELSESNTDIVNQINQSLGRIIELDKKEKEYDSIIDIEIANKTSEKNVLENQVSELAKQVTLLKSEKDSLIESIKVFQSINSGFFEKNIELEKQIGGIIELTSKNAREISSILENVKISSTEIIDINKKNVAETTMVIGELPRLFFDLQRQVMEKRERITKIKQ